MSEPPQTIQVIINPASGRPGDAILNVLHQVFTEEAGIKWNVSLTYDAGDGVRLAEEALARGPDAIAVYGGDGTVREVAGVLKGTGVPLAILPGGTGNLFAVQMRIPRALRRAARLVAGPHAVQQVDVGIANGEAFLVAAGTGVLADTMDGTDREAKNRMGYAAYLLSGVRKLMEVKHARYRVMLGGGQLQEGPGIACLVSNTNSVGISGLSVPAGGSNQDGLLDVMLFHDVDPQTVFSIVGNILGLEELTTPLVCWPATDVVLETDPPQLVTLDGDITGHTPLEISIAPGALRVITPCKDRNGCEDAS